MGRSWDELLEDRATLNDIDRKAIDYFLRKAIEAHRINPELKDEDTRTVLENLKLECSPMLRYYYSEKPLFASFPVWNSVSDASG